MFDKTTWIRLPRNVVVGHGVLSQTTDAIAELHLAGRPLVVTSPTAREVAGEEPIGASLGQAAVDQIRGSAYMQDLTSTPDTVPGVDYTVIGTRYDEVSTPYQATFLEEGPGSEVDNITLQRGCAIDLSDHLSMVYSPRAIDLTNRALSSRWTFVRCAPNAPIL